MVGRDMCQKGKKGCILAIALFLVLAFLLSIFLWWNNCGKYEAVSVLFLPDGFVSIDQINTLSEEPLECLFLEEFGNIVKTDENKSIAQFHVKDKSWIVRYRGKYYISSKKIRELDQP